MKIGVVDLNRALNESEAGIRSKNVLETKGRQKQQEFKLEEEELRELAEELRSNPLLTPKPKSRNSSSFNRVNKLCVQRSSSLNSSFEVKNVVLLKKFSVS